MIPHPWWNIDPDVVMEPTPWWLPVCLWSAVVAGWVIWRLCTKRDELLGWRVWRFGKKRREEDE